MSQMMRAVVQHRYGGRECLSVDDLPVPAPGAGQVRIRVHAAGVNPVDVKIRQGAMKGLRLHRLPFVAGNEVSGVVDEVGAGVNLFSVGERVAVRLDQRSMGGLAEYVVTEQDLLARLPDDVDFVTGAALPLVGLTALQALRDELHLEPGQQVFISAGAGGVGTTAIQLAKHLGAQVVTTASESGTTLVRELGADVVIDRNRPLDEVVERCDAALDLVGGDTLVSTFGIVKVGGPVVSLAGPPEPLTARVDLGMGRLMQVVFWLTSSKIRRIARAHGSSYRYLLMHPDRAQLEELLTMVTSGTLTVVIDQTYSFDRVLDAIAHVEAGHSKGKVVVTF